MLQGLQKPAFLAAKSDEHRENIKRLAWFTMEFGLIREKGERKLFGAGLIFALNSHMEETRLLVPVLFGLVAVAAERIDRPPGAW